MAWEPGASDPDPAVAGLRTAPLRMRPLISREIGLKL